MEVKSDYDHEISSIRLDDLEPGKKMTIPITIKNISPDQVGLAGLVANVINVLNPLNLCVYLYFLNFSYFTINVFVGTKTN